jgi:hypothetical protein
LTPFRSSYTNFSIVSDEHPPRRKLPSLHASSRVDTPYDQLDKSVYDSLDFLLFGEQIAGDTGPTTHKFAPLNAIGGVIFTGAGIILLLGCA